MAIENYIASVGRPALYFSATCASFMAGYATGAGMGISVPLAATVTSAPTGARVALESLVHKLHGIHNSRERSDDPVVLSRQEPVEEKNPLKSGLVVASVSAAAFAVGYGLAKVNSQNPMPFMYSQ